jgi:hypothetical protein
LSIKEQFMAHDMSHGVPHGDSHGGHYSGGFVRWLETTNHKDIGIMYLIFGFVMLFVGGAMILAVRAELFQPGLQLMQPEFFNQLITLHGLIMVFGFAMPVATGLANYMLPMVIGAPDMALPRLEQLGFLDLAAGRSDADAAVLSGHIRHWLGRGGYRLDPVRAAVDSERLGHGLCHFCHSHARCVVDSGLDQCHRDHRQHARAGHDADEDAACLRTAF